MNALTNTDSNFLDALEAAADRELGDGESVTYLKFKKGVWLAGGGENPADVGVDYIAGANRCHRGWIRWDGNRPVRREMRLMHEPEVMRETLGDTDDRVWPTDRDGKPRDAWQYTYELPLIVKDTGAKFIFSTTSVGGRKAISTLVVAYTKRARSGAGELPIVRLAGDSYRHHSGDRVQVPVLEIVGWIAADPDLAPPSAALELPSPADQLDDRIPF